MSGGRLAAVPASPWPGETDDDVSTRQLLRQVAQELFAEQGFQAVSLRQLAVAMGMQVGSLYNHIDSKQVLLFELIQDHESELLALLCKDLVRRAEGLPQLEAYVRLYLQFNCLHDQRHTLARLEFRSLAPEQQHSIKLLRQTHVDPLEDLLRRCALPARECGTIALGMRALLDGVVAGYPVGGRPPLGNLAALFSRMVMSGLSQPQA